MMALIELSSFQQLEKNRNSAHEPTTSTYSVFSIGDKKYLQIDTYGKAERKNPDKVSQSIQLTYETANFLVDVLTREFNLKK